jgi:hypothetical protein
MSSTPAARGRSLSGSSPFAFCAMHAARRRCDQAMACRRDGHAALGRRWPGALCGSGKWRPRQPRAATTRAFEERTTKPPFVVPLCIWPAWHRNGHIDFRQDVVGGGFTQGVGRGAQAAGRLISPSGMEGGNETTGVNFLTVGPRAAGGGTGGRGEPAGHGRRNRGPRGTDVEG